MYTKNKNIIHEAFEVGVLLKGLDGVLEIIGGVLLFFINPATINSILVFLTAHELSEDPKDILFNYIIKTAHDFSVSAQIFSSIYLFSHGVIKIVLVISLLKRKLWAYPTAIIFFFIFIIYQLYRYTYSHSIWLIALTILDIFVIWLTWMEYKRIKAKA